MQKYSHPHRSWILVVMTLAAISALVLITPGRAANQPVYSEGWIDFGGGLTPAAAVLNCYSGRCSLHRYYGSRSQAFMLNQQ